MMDKRVSLLFYAAWMFAFAHSTEDMYQAATNGVRDMDVDYDDGSQDYMMPYMVLVFGMVSNLLACNGALAMLYLAAMHPPRRLWTRDRSALGFWELYVRGCWKVDALIDPELEMEAYVRTYRFTKYRFWYTYKTYGRGLQKRNTKMRKAISGPKRFAIILHYLSHGLSNYDLAVGVVCRWGINCAHYHS